MLRARPSYTLASHINEGPDIFAEDYPLPPLEEGDIVALLGVGAYCQANWHLHCLRPFPGVLWFSERRPSLSERAMMDKAPTAAREGRQRPESAGRWAPQGRRTKLNLSAAQLHDHESEPSWKAPREKQRPGARGASSR